MALHILFYMIICPLKKDHISNASPVKKITYQMSLRKMVESVYIFA